MYKYTYPSTPRVEDVRQEVINPGQSLEKGGTRGRARADVNEWGCTSTLLHPLLPAFLTSLMASETAVSVPHTVGITSLFFVTEIH